MLNNAHKLNEFYFDYTLKGLVPDTKDGLRFLNESGEEVFSTPALFAIDAAGAVTQLIILQIQSPFVCV